MVHSDVTAQQVGPGLVHFQFSTVVGSFGVFETVTPVEPLLQRVTHWIYGSPWVRRVPSTCRCAVLITLLWRTIGHEHRPGHVLFGVVLLLVMLVRPPCSFAHGWQVPSPFGRGVFAGMMTQYERDAFVFNQKRFVSKPLLVKEDALIAKYRQWFSQFYSPSSFKAAKVSADGRPSTSCNGSWEW